ncbi:hypothetical protein EJB05_10168, partial [Eragrostis curvula]
MLRGASSRRTTTSTRDANQMSVSGSDIGSDDSGPPHASIQTRWNYTSCGECPSDEQALEHRLMPRSPKGPTARCASASTSPPATVPAGIAERGVTVVTAAADAGAPFGSFIAARGLVPVRAAGGRLPFFDGTLDIAHQLGSGGRVRPDDDDGVALEFAMCRRVLAYWVLRPSGLRPSGLFWLDHFVCPMLGRVGFKKLRWNTGRKPGRWTGNDNWYVSALLEKPMT